MATEERIITTHKIVSAIPWSETCFGCNGGANEGIGMRAYVTEDDYVVGLCKTKSGHQGFPGTVHGGLIATYFDEVFWHATHLDDPNRLAMTVEMSVRYKRPVAVEREVRVVAGKARLEGRHVYVDGFLLLPDDTVAATASIHYITLRPVNDMNESESARVKHYSHDIPVEEIRF